MARPTWHGHALSTPETDGGCRMFDPSLNDNPGPDLERPAAPPLHGVLRLRPFDHPGAAVRRGARVTILQSGDRHDL